MKVLHLVSNLNKGGAEKQLSLLVRETTDVVEHEVLAIQEEGSWAKVLRNSGAFVSCWFEPSLTAPSLLPRLASEIRRRRPDIVHCWLPSVNVLGGLAARLSGPVRPRVIASIRNVDDWKPMWRVWVDRAASLTWDGVISNSQAGLKCALGQGIPNRKLVWIPNGIEPRSTPSVDERREARRQLGIRPGQPVLAAASRLVPQKRVHLILDIAAVVRASFPTLQLLIAGDGPDRSWLEARDSSQSACLVRFLGALPDPWPILTAADAFVMTSEREGTSNSLLESMQAGCPVFATDAGDNRLLLGQPPCGHVGDLGDLASALTRALESPEELERMRQLAIARAAEFSVRRMARQTLNLYDQVLAAEALLSIEESSRA